MARTDVSVARHRRRGLAIELRLSLELGISHRRHRKRRCPSEPRYPTSERHDGERLGDERHDATLSGTVNPNGSDTSYAFEYGTTAAFAKTTVSEERRVGTSPVSVSVNLTGLKANTNYDFALVVTSVLGTVTGATQSFQTEESSCVAQAQVVSQDVESLRAANDTLAADRLNAGATVAVDRQSLASDQQALTVAEQALSADEATATNLNSTFTALPSIGEVISRGQSVYPLDRDPVPLFYGSVAPYRALYLGVSDGRT